MSFKPSVKTVFLVDGSGALLSAIFTGVVLPWFSAELGLPFAVLCALGMVAVLFATYSLSCFWFLDEPAPPLLAAILFANLLYCIVSGIVLVVTPTVTLWGLACLDAEILVILAIAALEFKTYRRLNHLTRASTALS